MKRIALWSLSTVAAVGLLLGYHTSTQGVPSARATAAAGVVSTGTVVDPVPAPPTTSSTTSPAPATTAPTTSKVINGAAVSTQYGDVQVQLTVTGGKVVKAVAIAYAQGGRDGEINAYAIPVLQQETVAAQSAHIDTVSGATFTSEGYLGSLQSALDAAGL